MRARNRARASRLRSAPFAQRAGEGGEGEAGAGVEADGGEVVAAGGAAVEDGDGDAVGANYPMTRNSPVIGRSMHPTSTRRPPLRDRVPPG